MKAVIPVAGLGTRLLPATKVVPKELMPVFDVPLLQLVVEEAMASDIEEVVLVVSPTSAWVANHFASQGGIVDRLRQSGKNEVADRIASITAPIRTVVQEQPLGLGHAVLCARDAIGSEPFAVLLPDDLFDSSVPAVRQLRDHHARVNRSVVALHEVPLEHVHRYGIVRPGERSGRGMKVTDLIEKPPQEQAPSRLAIPGRYVLEPLVFDLLAKTKPGSGGEIQLTDALRGLAASGRLDGLVVDGIRMDAGEHFGLLRASILRASRNPSLRERLRALLSEIASQPSEPESTS